MSPKNFEIPKAYISYRVRLNEEMDSILEYDVDEEVYFYDFSVLKLLQYVNSIFILTIDFC